MGQAFTGVQLPDGISVHLAIWPKCFNITVWPDVIVHCTKYSYSFIRLN